MNRYNRILFPVDFSERSRATAPFVHSMASRYGAVVTLLHVVPPPAPLYAGMDVIYPAKFNPAGVCAELMRKLAEFGQAELPRLNSRCVVEIGDPGSVIVEFARNNWYDLIALPTHGYGAFRRVLLGSVTAKVLHDASIPVWTSAHAPEPGHRAQPQPRHVLCALDLKPESLRILEHAIDIASDTSATLELVHAAPETYDFNDPEEQIDQIQNQIRTLLTQAAWQQLIKLQAEAGCDYQTVLAGGNVANLVRAVALRKRADLVVIGRGCIQSTTGRLRSNAYAIIREAPCPVLSV